LDQLDPELSNPHLSDLSDLSDLTIRLDQLGLLAQCCRLDQLGPELSNQRQLDLLGQLNQLGQALLIVRLWHQLDP
jgi:hypothetical protein